MKRSLLAVSVLIICTIGLLTSCDSNSSKHENPDTGDENGISDQDDTGDTTDTGDTQDSGDTGNTADDADTGDTTDTGDSSGDPDIADTGDTAGDMDTGDTSDTGDTGDLTAVFNLGPHFVNIIDIKEGNNGAPRNFRIYEPSGATGSVPVIHFQHGFQLKNTYYDDSLIHLSSHGFIVVSSQSAQSLIGGDTSVQEAQKVAEFINYMKTDLPFRTTVVPDIAKFGVAGHSRGGKVTNHVLNSNPSIAMAFFGYDPVDAAPPIGNDPPSLNNPVLFQGPSMFLGAQKGPEGSQACAPAGNNSVNFYFGFPSPSWHIIAAGVGHMDMIDPDDLSSCGMTCSVCAKSDNDMLNTQFRTYGGAMMAAFFSYSLKGMTEYADLLSNTMNHPFMNSLAEHK